MVAEKKPVQSYDVVVKDEALRLFLAKEMQAEEIVSHINRKHGTNISRSTLYNWVKEGNWEDIKAEIAVRTHQVIIDTEVERRKAASDQQIEDYQTILDKAKIDYPNLQFKTAGEAARVVDVAIRGQRNVQAGELHIEFIQDVFDVLADVIKDEEVLKLVAIKLKTVISKWDEKTSGTIQN